MTKRTRTPATRAAERHAARTEFEQRVDAKQQRKLAARREGDHSAWFGLGMFGLVGWSVTVPTLLAIALGVWIDRRWPSRFSWTLMLLFMGVVLGCINAWAWIARESQDHEEIQE